MDFDAADRVDDNERGVASSQRGFRIEYECGESRCIQNVDLGVIPLAVSE